MPSRASRKPLLATSSGELMPVAARLGPRDDAVRPRYERMEGIRDLWIASLKLHRVQYVFVSALSAYEIGYEWHNDRGFPIARADGTVVEYVGVAEDITERLKAERAVIDAEERMRFALVSCSNYPAGFFNVYASIAKRADLDAIVHVGDYIYEFGEGEYGAGAAINRIPQPARESISLADYRARYGTYRTDPDLQEAHRLFPFIAVWDDHELANDAWAGGAVNHNPEKGEGDWAARKAAGYKAYLEWMPIRESSEPGIHLFRTFRFGGLVDLVMLDTRALRDRQVASTNAAGLADPHRTLMGAAQEAWMFDELRASQRANTPWRLLGQQIMFAPITPPGTRPTNTDAWDGYPAQRGRVLDFVEREGIRDLVILTGDAHSSWGFDIPRNPWNGYRQAGAGSLAVEFVTPAISSPPPAMFGSPNGTEAAAAVRVALPHLKYLDGVRRGYVVVDVTPMAVRANWYFSPDVRVHSDAEVAGGSVVCERGSAHLQMA